MLNTFGKNKKWKTIYLAKSKFEKFNSAQPHLLHPKFPTKTIYPWGGLNLKS